MLIARLKKHLPLNPSSVWYFFFCILRAPSPPHTATITDSSRGFVVARALGKARVFSARAGSQGHFGQPATISWRRKVWHVRGFHLLCLLVFSIYSLEVCASFHNRSAVYVDIFFFCFISKFTRVPSLMISLKCMGFQKVQRVGSEVFRTSHLPALCLRAGSARIPRLERHARRWSGRGCWYEIRRTTLRFVFVSCRGRRRGITDAATVV